MMTRTQISLDRELLRRARRKASEQRISLAEYMRRLVTADLEPPPATGDVSAIFGMISTGGTNIARDKDKMVGEAVRKLHGK
ncbi:MAG: hypothetical protein FJ207_10105 [Gemmatimonadetes bacterium]|nr:hypothetical protein [Gemmatimonadota bacterium]